MTRKWRLIKETITWTDLQNLKTKLPPDFHAVNEISGNVYIIGTEDCDKHLLFNALMDMFMKKPTKRGRDFELDEILEE